MTRLGIEYGEGAWLFTLVKAVLNWGHCVVVLPR